MSDTLNAVVNQDTLSPMARLAAQAGQGIWNWGGLMGLPSLHDLITGNVNQPTGTISAQNAPQFPADAPSATRPDFPAGPRVYPPSATRPDIVAMPQAPQQSATRPDIVAPPPPPQPAPRPVSKVPTLVKQPHPDDPVTPGRPGAPTPESNSRQQQIVDDMQKVVDRLLNPPPGPTLNLERLPSPPPIQQQQSWMSTILSSAGLVLATFGARRSAAPMTAALKSFGGYLQGYQEGNKEVAQQQYQNFKSQLEIAIERNKEEMDGYRATLEAKKGNAEELRDALYGMSLINENEHAQGMLAQSKLKDFEEYQLGMQQHTLELQKMWLKIQEYNQNAAVLGLPTIDAGPYPTMTGGDAIDNAIRGQEGSGPESVSPKGARGGMQIIRTTFEQYKQPGESFDNEQDRTAAAERYLAHLKQLYPDDPARIAVAYFSGEDNVAPPGSPTPWKVDKSDGNTSTSAYVSGVLSRMGGQQMDGTKVAGASATSAATVAAPATGGAGTPIDQAASDYIDTGKLPDIKGPTSGAYQTAVLAAAARKTAALNDVLSKLPANATPEQAQAALAQLNPEAATIVKAMIDGTYPVPTSAWAMRGKYWPTMFAIAKKIAPNLDANTYETRKAIIKDIFVGKDGQNLTSVATAYKHGAALIASAAGLTKGDRFTGVLGNTAIGNLLSSTELAEYNANRLDFAGEYAKALYGGGGTGSERDTIYNSLSPGKSAPALAATIRTYIARLREKMQESRVRLTALGAAGNMQDVQRLFQIYTQEDPTILGQLASDPGHSFDPNNPDSVQ